MVGREATLTCNYREALSLLKTRHFSLAFIDYSIARETTDSGNSFHACAPDLLCVMLTPVLSAKVAVDALRLGAFDLLSKPLSPDEIKLVLKRAEIRLHAERSRVANEDAVRAGGERFRDFAEIAADWFWEIDEDYVLTFLSSRYEEHSGVQRAEVLGQPRLDLLRRHCVDPSTADRHRDLLARRESYRDFTFQWRRPKDGRIITLSTSGKPIFDANREFRGYRGVSTNVTAQKEAEIALALSEERFRDFAEIGADWFWETDAELRFSYLSESYQAATGLDPSQILGRTRRELFSERVYRSPALEAHFRTLEKHEPYDNIDFEWIRPDGATCHLRNSGRPVFDDDGQFTGYRGAGRDVTEEIRAANARRRLEAQLRQVQKMESVGQLAGGIAHDFNNILGSVLGYPELSLRYHVADPDSRLAHYMREARKACERARLTVRQLLMYSRGGEGEFESLGAGEIIAEGVDLMKHALPSDIVVSSYVAPDLPMINTVPGQLGQVLMNLAANANRAQNQNGGGGYFGSIPGNRQGELRLVSRGAQRPFHRYRFS